MAREHAINKLQNDHEEISAVNADLPVGVHEAQIVDDMGSIVDKL
jgi:hypothetical protein